MRRSVLVLSLAILVALAGVLGWRWYAYATAGEPYEEVGIELNSRMPGPLRRWTCARVRERHPGTLPPYGCSAP